MPASKGSYQISEFTAMIYRVVLGSGCLLILAIAQSIPFYFVTTTLWYKYGIDKVMLIIGQHIGLLALMLLYLQIVLSARSPFFEAVWGSAALVRMHRVNGLLLFSLAAFHILLVLIPEGLANLPLGKKFWPELVGAALFLILALQVGSSYFRDHLHLPYGLWKRLHSPLGFLAVVLVTVHVLFVSESFEQPLPRLFLLTLFILVVGWTAGVKFRGRNLTQQTSNKEVQYEKSS